ncbi:MAG: flagellar export chaperone FliS [Proteobacteria bacterium]|nr:flagellar export chaperone FliS [Pseudomonadota bacterium]
MPNKSAQHVAYATAAQNASKTRQVVMLYDGVISMVQRAVEAIKEGQLEERYMLIDKARKIVCGLQTALDFDNAPDIAKLMYDYYESIDMRMIHVQSTNRADVLAQVEKELKIMRDAWKTIDEAAEKEGKKQDTKEMYATAYEAVTVATASSAAESSADSVSISV